MPATGAAHGLLLARPVATSAPSNSAENARSLITVVLKNAIQGFRPSTAHSATRVRKPNPAAQNQRHARAINTGSMSQVSAISHFKFSGNCGAIFQIAASISGHSGGYFVWNGSAGRLRIR